jgi:hypothetical protein
MRRTDHEPTLASLLRRILDLLTKVEPERQEGDTVWQGPFFIPRRGQWWPTRFLRYRDELYCSVELGWSTATLVWNIGSNKVAFEGDASFGLGFYNGPELWREVLGQVLGRLKRAVQNPAAYNRHVARHLPARCRSGRIRRRLTWPKASPKPISKGDLGRLENALERGKRARSWRSMSLHRYLGVAALAYDAVFDDLKDLDPREKYGRRADRRHGGMLDLPPQDSAAFERWYSSREWLGSHPWEIVFAHPHGVLLSPHCEGRAWRFFLSVDTLGLYIETARMAIAIGEAGVPFEVLHANEIIATLRGEDLVEVGPFHGQLALDELESRRKGVARQVAWDPPPLLRLRNPDQSPGQPGHI